MDVHEPSDRGVELDQEGNPRANAGLLQRSGHTYITRNPGTSLGVFNVMDQQARLPIHHPAGLPARGSTCKGQGERALDLFTSVGYANERQSSADGRGDGVSCAVFVLRCT